MTGTTTKKRGRRRRKRRRAPREIIWTRVATAAPIVGLLLVGVLIWGIVFANDVWPARAFVLLFYGALGCTLAAYGVPHWMAKRGLPPVREWVTDVRGALSIFVAVFACWAWLPFFARPLVGWLMRMTSALRWF